MLIGLCKPLSVHFCTAANQKSQYPHILPHQPEQIEITLNEKKNLRALMDLSIKVFNVIEIKGKKLKYIKSFQVLREKNDCRRTFLFAFFLTHHSTNT